MGKRQPVSSGVQELELRFYFPKNGVQTHFGGRAVRDRTLSKDGRTSSKGEPLNSIRPAKHTIDEGREASLEIVRPVSASGSKLWV